MVRRPTRPQRPSRFQQRGFQRRRREYANWANRGFRSGWVRQQIQERQNEYIQQTLRELAEHNKGEWFTRYKWGLIFYLNPQKIRRQTLVPRTPYRTAEYYARRDLREWLHMQRENLQADTHIYRQEAHDNLLDYFNDHDAPNEENLPDHEYWNRRETREFDPVPDDQVDITMPDIPEEYQAQDDLPEPSHRDSDAYWDEIDKLN